MVTRPDASYLVGRHGQRHASGRRCRGSSQRITHPLTSIWRPTSDTLTWSIQTRSQPLRVMASAGGRREASVPVGGPEWEIDEDVPPPQMYSAREGEAEGQRMPFSRMTRCERKEPTHEG